MGARMYRPGAAGFVNQDTVPAANLQSRRCTRGEMVELTYRLESGPNFMGWERHRDSGAASRRDLLLSFFPGDIGIITDDAEFETNFGWVPILHFAMSMVTIHEELTAADHVVGRYVFTEATEVLSFRRNGMQVMIAPSFRSTRMTCSVEELRSAIKAFVPQVLSGIGSEYPALSDTDLAREMTSRAEALLVMAA